MINEDLFKKYNHLKIYSEVLNNGGQYILKKEIVTDFPYNFMSPELEKAIDDGNVEYTTTSGTTSDRMQIVRKKKWWLDEYKRTYSNNSKLNEVIINKKKKAILTTAVCSNTVCYLCKPSYEDRIINDTLYLNINHNPWAWTVDEVKNMNDEIKEYDTYYLDVDPVYFYIFLQKCKQYDIKYVDLPKVITLSYEYCPKNIKKYISENVSAEILDLYGTTEFGYVFLSCNNSEMKLCPDLVDVDFEKIPGCDHIYELIITSLKNEFMPLINYKVGDLVEMSDYQLSHFESDKKITRIAGRKNNLIIFNDATVSLSMIDDIISSDENIILYKFEILSEQKMALKLMLLDNEKKVDSNLISKLEKLLSIEIETEYVVDIMPEMSGKFCQIKL